MNNNRKNILVLEMGMPACIGFDKNSHTRLDNIFQRTPSGRIEIFPIKSQTIKRLPDPVVDQIIRIHVTPWIFGIRIRRMKRYLFRIAFQIGKSYSYFIIIKTHRFSSNFRMTIFINHFWLNLPFRGATERLAEVGRSAVKESFR